MEDSLNPQRKSVAQKDQKTEPEKEGIEKIDLPPRYEYETGPDGKVVEKVIPQWEIRAKGSKYVQELRGIFKDSATEMMHEGMKEWNANGGDLKITRPDGSVDTVRADKEELYRRQPGFCETATRPTVGVNGFGGMRKRGLTRFKASFKGGEMTVLEER